MAIINTIHASIKISPQIRGTYYSIEYGEERTLTDNDNIEIEKEKLFDDCYNAVAEQIIQIQKGGN